MTDDTPPRSDGSHDVPAPPGLPGWVKAIAIAVLVLVVVVVLAMILGIGGEHGPGRHG